MSVEGRDPGGVPYRWQVQRRQDDDPAGHLCRDGLPQQEVQDHLPFVLVAMCPRDEQCRRAVPSGGHSNGNRDDAIVMAVVRVRQVDGSDLAP